MIIPEVVVNSLFWLILLSVFLEIDPVTATPCFRRRKPIALDIPGLWLVHIDSYSPEFNCDPDGQYWGRYSFRVYCPTKMIRDVSGGRWGPAQSLKQIQSEDGYPIGAWAYEQACQR